MSGTAVHFGAGNIGRGFIGLVLHRAGYEVVFADVADALIDALATTPRYVVRAVGEGGGEEAVEGYRAVNSRAEPDRVVAEVAGADVVTTAVGPTVLRFVAPTLLAGLRARPDGAPPLAVMACENAIGATDQLVQHVRTGLTDDEWAPLAAKAVFANTAVDRIVPAQAPGQGLDVTVEPYFEWAVETGPFGGAVPSIPDAHFVPDLAPYIERKLFTVNTGHATTAYHGYAAGAGTISEALGTAAVRERVEGVLGETTQLLVAKHGFPEDVQRAYAATTVGRFTNPHLPDTVERVGRQPLRKLSRGERLVGPALQLAERGGTPNHLLATVGAALRFDVADDPEAVELQRLLAAEEPAAATTTITGLQSGEPLFDDVRALVQQRREQRAG